MHRRVVFAFRNDTEIGPKHTKAQNYNMLLKDIPMNELLDAMNLKQMSAAVKSIFSILSRVRTFNHYEQNQYSIERVIELTDCIARDFDTKLKKVMSERPVMQIAYAQHKEIQQEVNKLEEQWRTSIQELKAAMSRTGGNQRFKGRQLEDRLKTISDDPVFRRLNSIIIFRSEHHKLESVISTTF